MFGYKRTCHYVDESWNLTSQNKWDTKDSMLLMPEIPTTQEAEIWRIKVWRQSRKLDLESLSGKYPIQNRWRVEWLKWYHTCLGSIRPRVQTPVPPKPESSHVVGLTYRKRKQNNGVLFSTLHCLLLFILFYFWQYWNLNSTNCTCWASALPLDPHLQSYCFR
jgi:hypothetical protein